MKSTLLAIFISFLFANTIAQNYSAYFAGSAEGENNNIEIPALNVAALPITIEAWFKPEGIQNDYASIWFTRNGSASPTGIFIRPAFSNQLRSVWENNNSTTETPLIVTNDQWQHAALVVTQTAKKLYLDGVLFDYNTDTNPTETFDTPTRLGWDDALPGRTFKGLIDEVRIWNTARTEDQIKATQFETLQGNEEGLLGYWPFDDNATQATDYTANGYNGTLNGVSITQSDLFAPMALVAANTSQTNISAQAGSSNNKLLQLTITTENSASPLVLKSIELNSNGTTTPADIKNITVYYTEANDFFSTSTLFGTAEQTIDAQSFSIAGNQPLQEGINYLWITCDIAENAQPNNIIDAECIAFTLQGELATKENPETTAPEGKLTIASKLTEPQNNMAIYFTGASDGIQNNVEIPALNISSLPVTIEAWFKPEGNQNDYASIWFTRSATTQPTGIFMRPTYSNQLRSVWENQNSPDPTTLIVTNDEWHHAALVVTATAKKLYLDGELFDYQTNTNPVATFSSPSHIGWDNALPGRTFRGLIDEVRIWNTARTEEELETYKLQQLTGNEDNLVGYWNFDDSNAQATDYTNNGNNGTINGGTYLESDLFAAMTYTSSLTEQKSSITSAGSENNQLIQLIIETENRTQPLALDQIQLSLQGTSDISDIAALKIYYTQNSNTFETATLFGQTNENLHNENIAIEGNLQLQTGKNYFWVTCDISPLAENGDQFDAQCISFALNGENLVPSTTDPAGALTVNNNLLIPFKTLPPSLVTSSGQNPAGGANFVSFQQNAIMTFDGYQYVTYWNNKYKVCIARRQLPADTWEILEFSDYTVTAARVADNHYSISMGICPNNGTIHIAYDHHGDDLNYRISQPGLAFAQSGLAWNASSFSSNRDYLINGETIKLVTYPRFVTKPNGDLLYECRLGTSGSGDSYLWEYSANTGAWTYIGKYLDGISLDPDQNAYINGIHYDPNGRLHVSWVWRVTPDPVTNHDIYYGYSDDNGRTWQNSSGEIAATINTAPMSLHTQGLKVISIDQNRGLINQESQAVDSKGGIHILQSYMLDSEANSSNFWGSRDKAYLRHIYKNENDQWKSDVIPAISRDRSEIAVDANDNIYVVCPNYRVYFASSAGKWQEWVEFDISNEGTAVSEGLIDRELLLQGTLSFVFAQNNGNIIVPQYRLEKIQKGKGLAATYYNTPNFEQIVYQNTSNVDFHWADSLSLKNHNKHNFSAQYQGKLETQGAEEYSLHFTTSGALQVWINNQLTIDETDNTDKNVFTVSLSPSPSNTYDITIKASYSFQQPTLIMEWESQLQERNAVPQSALYPADFIESPNPFTANLQLQKGWNFIGISCNPVKTAIPELFPNATIIKNFEGFYQSSTDPIFNSLQHIKQGEAYFVNNAIDEIVAIEATPLIIEPKTLAQGWNMTAYPYTTPAGVEEALLNTIPSLEIIKNFNSFYIPNDQLSGLKTLNPYNGYLIKMNKNHIVEW